MGSLRSKCDGTINKCVPLCGAPYNRSSLFTEHSVFKVSANQDGSCNLTQNTKEPLNNRRLLSTSSADQTFGSSKSLSNTEVTSQTSVLSSTSCSSSSSLLSSSCGLVLAKESSPGIKTSSQHKHTSYQSMDANKHSIIASTRKSAEKNTSTEPPPIPPKTASNQNSLTPTDTSPPALPTTPPPIHLNRSPDSDRTSTILNSIKIDSDDEENQSLNESLPIISKEFEDISQENHIVNDNVNNKSNNTTDRKPIDVNKQIKDTPDLINAVIYIDDEDDLSPTATTNNKSI